MTKAPNVSSSVVKRAVQALRQDALSFADGELIGSEDELLQRHNVSRPTLRQAAALVAQEQLLKIKRGVGGGYIARRPTSRAVAHMAAVFLQTRGAGLGEIIQSVEPIRAELARLAALNVDDEGRQAIRDFLAREEERNEEDAYWGFIRGERDFGQLMGQISRNHVMSLFLEILYDLAATLKPEHDIYRGRPDRIAEYRGKRNRIAEAVLDGDADLAVLTAHRCSSLGVGWMLEDLGKAYPTGQSEHGGDLVGMLGAARVG
jgi:GntR family transcriptional regulator, transcriptional repressor for pyruvate dehydrogenase complex